MNEHALSFITQLTADPYPTPDYRVCRTLDDLCDYVYTSPEPSSLLIAEDTESLPDGSPYCLTFSIAPGTARLIYAHDTHLISEYRTFLETCPLWDGRTIHHLFHNYLHDINPFEHWEFPVEKFTDTMVRAYNLCLGGGGDDDEDSFGGRGFLGLKPLSWRNLHMRMTSFKDTVYPHSKPIAIEWLQTALQLTAPLEKVKAPKREKVERPPKGTCICGHLKEGHLPRGATGKVAGMCLDGTCACDRYKAWAPPKVPRAPKAPAPTRGPKTIEDKQLTLLHRKIKGLLKDLTEDPTCDPWKRHKAWHDYDYTHLEILGPIPRPSIAHVPESDLLFYACRDADATLRLFRYMQPLKPWIFYPRTRNKLRAA